MEGYRGSMRLDGYLLKDIDATPTRDGEIFPIFAPFLFTRCNSFLVPPKYSSPPYFFTRIIP